MPSKSFFCGRLRSALEIRVGRKTFDEELHEAAHLHGPAGPAEIGAIAAGFGLTFLRPEEKAA